MIPGGDDNGRLERLERVEVWEGLRGGGIALVVLWIMCFFFSL